MTTASAPPVGGDSASADAGLDGFLANALVGESRTLAFDGQRVRVTAGERYTSASGRECRRLRVSAPAAGPGAAQQLRVACATPEGWRMPRSILANAIGR